MLTKKKNREISNSFLHKLQVAFCIYFCEKFFFSRNVFACRHVSRNYFDLDKLVNELKLKKKSYKSGPVPIYDLDSRLDEIS